MSGKSSRARRTARRSRPAPSLTLSPRDVADLMRHGVSVKRKRATQSGMRSGDGSGRLSAWTQPATLPYTLAVPGNDKRLDGRVLSTRRPDAVVTAY
jgi:hypothetical protein